MGVRSYNKKVEITRVFQHYIFEWEDSEDRKNRRYSTNLDSEIPNHGTEVYDDKEKLLQRLRTFL